MKLLSMYLFVLFMLLFCLYTLIYFEWHFRYFSYSIIYIFLNIIFSYSFLKSEFAKVDSNKMEESSQYKDKAGVFNMQIKESKTVRVNNVSRNSKTLTPHAVITTSMQYADLGRWDFNQGSTFSRFLLSFRPLRAIRNSCKYL